MDAEQKRAVNRYSPLTLAFLGDAVYEELVRMRIVEGANVPVGKLHRLSVRYVCAEFQSAAVRFLSEILTDEERDILRRGRNANGVNIPKHASAAQYRSATGLETLFGYLKLCGEDARIDALFAQIWDNRETLAALSDKEPKPEAAPIE
ncbi:MAG: ribonuclease III domain-containing protein [Oscillospiraceae bacterium]